MKIDIKVGLTAMLLWRISKLISIYRGTNPLFSIYGVVCKDWIGSFFFCFATVCFCQS